MVAAPDPRWRTCRARLTVRRISPVVKERVGRHVLFLPAEIPGVDFGHIWCVGSAAISASLCNAERLTHAFLRDFGAACFFDLRSPTDDGGQSHFFITAFSIIGVLEQGSAPQHSMNPLKRKQSLTPQLQRVLMLHQRYLHLRPRGFHARRDLAHLNAVGFARNL